MNEHQKFKAVLDMQIVRLALRDAAFVAYLNSVLADLGDITDKVKREITLHEAMHWAFVNFDPKKLEDFK